MTKDENKAPEGPGKRPASTLYPQTLPGGFKTPDATLLGEKWLEVIISGAVGTGTLIHRR